MYSKWKYPPNKIKAYIHISFNSGKIQRVRLRQYIYEWIYATNEIPLGFWMHCICICVYYFAHWMNKLWTIMLHLCFNFVLAHKKKCFSTWSFNTDVIESIQNRADNFIYIHNDFGISTEIVQPENCTITKY